jgi:predicted secreted protein
MFVAIVTPDIFRAFALGNRLLANLTGLVLGAVVLYIAPPRPKLWMVLLMTGLIALVFVALYFLHVG